MPWRGRTGRSCFDRKVSRRARVEMGTSADLPFAAAKGIHYRSLYPREPPHTSYLADVADDTTLALVRAYFQLDTRLVPLYKSWSRDPHFKKKLDEGGTRLATECVCESVGVVAAPGASYQDQGSDRGLDGLNHGLNLLCIPDAATRMV